MEDISSEELFDLWHLQGNCVDIEWHSMENGDAKLACLVRDIRQKINGLVFDKMENPQLLCTYKHLLSVRIELMELMEKWEGRGDEELVQFAKQKIDEVSEKLLETIQEIRGESLDFDTT